MEAGNPSSRLVLNVFKIFVIFDWEWQFMCQHSVTAGCHRLSQSMFFLENAKCNFINFGLMLLKKILAVFFLR